MSGVATGVWEDREVAARWALESAGSGWVDATTISAGAAAASRVAALEAQVAALEALLEAAREDGRASGRADAAAELDATIEAVQQTRSTLLRRAVDVACSLAALFVQHELGANRTTLEAVVQRTTRLRPGEAPNRVLVATGYTECVQAAFGAHAPPIHEDPTLGIGDVILEFEDWRVDGRIERLLLAAQDDVRDALLGAS